MVTFNYDNLERIRKQATKSYRDDTMLGSIILMGVEYTLMLEEEKYDDNIKCWFEKYE